LKKGELYPVYLFYGDDVRSMDMAVKALEKKVVDPELSEFNSDYFYGKESEISEVLSSAQTLPMMTERRFVLLKRVDETRGSDRERLIEYVKAPNSSTVLLLVTQNLSLKGQGARKEDFSLVNAVSSTGMAVSFANPYMDKLPAHIDQMARERGKRTSREAVRLLMDLTGSDMKGIEQELEKICLFIGERQTIEADDVTEVVADIREGKIFEFTDAMGDRNIKASLQIYRRMREERQEPLMILAMLLRHFRTIWQIQECLEEGMSDSQVAKKLKLNPYIFTKTYKPRAGKFKGPDTGKIATVLSNLDLKLKSTAADKDIMFERTVIKLCLGRPL